MGVNDDSNMEDMYFAIEINSQICPPTRVVCGKRGESASLERSFVAYLQLLLTWKRHKLTEYIPERKEGMAWNRGQQKEDEVIGSRR